MPQIEHFAIFAADPATLKTFYKEALGFRVVVDNGHTTPPGYFLAGDDGSALEIIGRPAGVGAVDTRHVCHVAFRVDDYDAAKSALERRGVRFETDSEVLTDSFRTGFFDDPDGNRCQIIWRDRPLGS